MRSNFAVQQTIVEMMGQYLSSFAADLPTAKEVKAYPL